jgi:hypothetical protein
VGMSSFSVSASNNAASKTLITADTRRGETVLGFYVRAGLWIDGIEILTSSGRRSGVFGNATGGSG